MNTKAGHGAPTEGPGPLERKIGLFVRVSEAELKFLAELRQDVSGCPADLDLITQGEQHDQTLIVLDGWAMRHRTLSDGRRQIVNFVLPGDFVGLHGLLFERSDHYVTTLTPARVARFAAERVVELFERFPRLAAAVAWTAAREESVIAERVASIGRRTAYERMAHLLLELLYRLRSVGIATRNGFRLPLTQEILADVLGLSVVHVSRTLRRLRQSGLIQLEARQIVLPDVKALSEAADFEPVFLHLGPPSHRIKRELAEMEDGTAPP